MSPRYANHVSNNNCAHPSPQKEKQQKSLDGLHSQTLSHSDVITMKRDIIYNELWSRKESRTKTDQTLDQKLEDKTEPEPWNLFKPQPNSGPVTELKPETGPEPGPRAGALPYRIPD